MILALLITVLPFAARAVALPGAAAVCAVDGGTCTLAAGTTATVYYGAQGTFTSKSGVTGSIACSPAAFGGDPVVNVLKACYAVTTSGGGVYASSLPTAARQCAAQGGTCTVAPGAANATVYYGAGAAYLFKTGVTGSLSCTAATFGADPNVGVSESCYVNVLPAGVAACAIDYGQCTLLSGVTATVYYGAGSSYLSKSGVTRSFSCVPATFGGDPDVGVVKTCYVLAGSSAGGFAAAALPAGAAACATGETGTCVLIAGTVATVYYGAGTQYHAKQSVTGSIGCNAGAFGGDPDVGVVKTCFALPTSPGGEFEAVALPGGAGQCAQAESGICVLAPGTTATVYYGAGAKYAVKEGVTGSIPCDQYAFGIDPDPYVVKACYTTDPVTVAGYVNLSAVYNVPAISTDSSVNGALMYGQAGLPYTYSQTLLGGQVSWNGSVFVLGAAGVNDAVSSTTVALPAGNFGRLDVLASRVNGSKAGEAFTVTYTDGTVSSFSQGMSDWWHNSNGTANFAGESTVAYMSYLHNATTGSAQPQAASLFGYTFALNPLKTVKSVTLPQDPDVGVLAMNLGAANVAPAIPTPGAAVSVVTHHNDTWRTGSNAAEYQLTPATVGNLTGSKVFGRLGSITLDEECDTQPLVVPNVSVTGDPNAGTHDVVYLATKSNTVYAIDPIRITILAQRNLGTGVPNPIGFGQGVAGTRSTPVIDTSLGVMYVMAYVQAASGPQYVLHKLSLTTLSDVVPPVTVAASAPTTTGALTFNPTYEMQRPALLESGGRIIVAFGSWGDLGANLSRGWVLSFDSGTLALNTAGVELTDKLGNDVNSFYLSSVWMSGAGPAVDENGYVYFSTGNSDAGTYDGVQNIQESVVKLNPSNGQVLSLYTPDDVYFFDQSDMDIGSGGVLLLPNAAKRVGAILSKDGLVRVFDRDNLGGNNDANLLTTAEADYCDCALSYFNDGQDRLVSSGGQTLRLFTWQTGTTSALTPEATASIPGVPSPGAFTSISSGAGANTIIWVVPPPYVNGAAGLNLMAFQATPVNGTLPLLYLAPAGGWLYGDGGSYHVPPTVANGRVYVASNKLLTIFGFGGTR